MHRFIFLILGSAFLFLRADTPIMPLSKVKPGMFGEWKTVVEGNQMGTYQLQILGIKSDYYGGVDIPIIIAKALDDSHKQSGPVAGMSGSPVYIKGKLIGAYAYGQPGQKNEAIIGITPIENMLSVLDKGDKNKMRQVDSDPSNYSLEKVPQEFSLKTTLEATPTPLLMGGFSSKSLEHFAPEWKALGFNPVNALSGTTQNIQGLPLTPGNPVAAVLCQGDFQVAATGTVTWRSGDQILAFGHGFTRLGSCSIPMAKAEILTIVQTLMRSYKLSNVAPGSGTIYQDRRAGIAGKVNQLPQMIPLSIQVKNSGYRNQSYHAELWNQQDFTPLMASNTLSQSIEQAETSGGIRTNRVEADITFQDGSILEWADLATGKRNGYSLAKRFHSWAKRLWRNPFEEVAVKSISFQVESIDDLHETLLKRVLLSQKSVEPGQYLDLEVRLSSYRGEAFSRKISIKIPDTGLDTNFLQLHLLDASEAKRLLRQTGTPLVDDWKSLLQDLRRYLAPDKMYLFLTQNNEGVHLDGTDLPGLPSSVQHLMGSDQWEQVKSDLNHEILWESSIDFQGVFRGKYQTNLEINFL